MKDRASQKAKKKVDKQEAGLRRPWMERLSAEEMAFANNAPILYLFCMKTNHHA
jgi:hypothetical protein